MTTRKSGTVLDIEQLETREVPATAALSNGILRVNGTATADVIRLTQNRTRIIVEDVSSFRADQVRVVSVDGRGGSDRIDLRGLAVGAAVRTEVFGRGGNDFIWGSRKADIIDGGAGDDRLFGNGGPDTLLGGDGNDRLFGEAGFDSLHGQAGSDLLDDGNRLMQEKNVGGDHWDWDADVLAVGGVAETDIRQGSAPTCSILSTLSGLAYRKYDLLQRISYQGPDANGALVYDVSLWNGSSWQTLRVAFTGETANDPKPAAEGESWVLLLQRAWIDYHGNNGLAWPHEALVALTGQSASSVKYAIASTDLARMTDALNNGKVVLTATSWQCNSPSLVAGHAYTVLGVGTEDGQTFVTLRNPWGFDGREASGDAADGIVRVSWADFQVSMMYLCVAG